MSEAPPSPSSTAENASASVVGGLESDVMVIVSSTLSEFFQHNTPDTATVATSAKILQTLLQNAMRKDEPHRKIRLGNPKIQRNVVHVRGALDILGLAGFVTVEQMEGDTTSLFLIMPDPHRDPTHPQQQQQQQQQRALVHAICDGLQVKLQELLESSSSSTAAPQHLLTDKNTHKKQKTTAGTIRTVDSSNNGPFLSEEERRLRQVKATAMKKAKKEAQKIALQKWEEDKQDRKQAAERREALLQANTIDAAGIKIPKETRKAMSLPLAKSMATAVDLDQQKEALAALARARYEQMKASSPPIKQSPIKQPDTKKDTTHMNTDTAMEDLEEDQKLPATNSIVSPPAPSLLPQDSINVDTNGMTTQWKQFVQHNPRCASAEGIRDSSCYSRRGGAGAGANPDLSIPSCLKHLFKELDGLKDSLPADSNASIWLRFDEETPQYIRVMMAAPLPGPTPYSGGVFLFDIYIPGNYPHVPPKVTLLTTGGGKVRFGPNLYADGKVCLSLLGTWSGPKWNPSHSSLYQVLISIQGLILGIEHPYYLEPGHGGWEGNVKEGDFQLTGHTLKGEQVKEEVGVPIKVVLYEDALRVGTVKYAMLDPLAVALSTTNLSSVQNKSGSSSNILWQPFRSILQAHFAMNRAEIMTEVRKWMSDQALGRNRSSISHTTLTIDQLNALMPKLETRLSNVSIPERDNSIDTNATPARGLNTDTQIGIDMKTKPAAKPAPATLSEVVAEKRAYDASRDNCMVTETTQVKDNSGKVDVVEEKRQTMQAAASNGDYILAGQLQEEVKRLEDLKLSMEEAAKQGDFIRAGRLQAQFKALTSHEKPANIKTAPAKSKSHQAVDEDMMDEDEFDSSDDDEDDDDDMSTEGAGIFGNTAGAGGLPTVPHELGKYVHSSSMGLRHHTWGSGSKLAAAPTPATSTSSKVTNETPTVAKRIIPVEQLCRLRLRLPHAGNKSVVEDFDKTEPLSAVYRRLEDLVPGASGQKGSATIAPRVAGSGAFAQPLSSAGFTLLLTRPKREFGLEMHGTKSLADLNLAPSATLTVMKCSDRGVMFRGELESRLRQAQGDAIDVEGLTYEGLVELTERLGTAVPADGMPFVALSRKELEENSETFSPFTYLTELNSCKGKTDEDELRCPICLGDYDSTDSNKSLRKLTNCNHMFHTGCLETWLGTKSSCPLCKMSVCPTPSNLAY